MAETPQANHPTPKRLRDHLDSETIHKLAALFLVVFVFTILLLIAGELFGGTERLKTLVESAGAWAPAVYIAVKMATYIFAPLSGASIEMAAGALFGLWPAVLLSCVGSTLGGTVNYWVARIIGRKGVEFFAGKKSLAHIDQTAQKLGGWKALLVARLALAAIYDFVSYAAGLVRIPYWQYLLITFFVGLPVTLIFPLLGHLSAESRVASYIVIGLITMLSIALGLLLLVRRRRQKVPKI